MVWRLARRVREGQWIRKGVDFLIARGRAANPATGDDGQSKGVLMSKTINATLAGLVYSIGVARGWWTIPEEEFLAIGIPLIAAIGAIWGRLVANKPVGK